MKSTLVPTEAELEEVYWGKLYWQELTPCVEEENIASQDSKDMRPSTMLSHPIPFTNILFRFHSATSACNRPTCNTNNVPEAQLEVGTKEEAGLNDEIEEPENERM
ncbi:hypothetical protein Adt_42742 [Abeliophyllum distichum]|uniref:Uncharacterized protein n=1 Tax=Abeliophyllum distichum TaxID=126358 RepID=A0ABD1PSJ4_9LAMI